MKKVCRDGVFTNLPNVGKEIAADFVTIGLKKPADLVGKDPHALYLKLCAVTHAHHDPCVLDAFMSAVDYMEGNPPKPWWAFTPLRKKRYRL